MNIFFETIIFTDWLDKLKDRQAKIRILARIRSATAGNFGDCKSVGEGVFEMRIDYGAGYRVYYGKRGQQIYLLIMGGDKSSQKRDIKRAGLLWRKLRETGK